MLCVFKYPYTVTFTKLLQTYLDFRKSDSQNLLIYVGYNKGLINCHSLVNNHKYI